MNRLAKIDIRRFEKAVQKYINIQAKAKEASDLFNNEKEEFAKAADIFFQLKGDNESYPIECLDESYLVSKIQKVNIQWNTEKLRKAIGKIFSNVVILKRYEIRDMKGLIEYLKSCGVDPKVFKSFLNIEEIVDVKELERLEEIGKITKEQLKGCYETKLQKPYYSVRKGRKMDGK